MSGKESGMVLIGIGMCVIGIGIGMSFARIPRQKEVVSSEHLRITPARDAEPEAEHEERKEPTAAKKKQATKALLDLLDDSETPDNLEMVKYLVSQGANVNASDKDGYTPLLLAAAVSGNLETVKYLISKGADVDAEIDSGTRRGHTALMLAALRAQDLEMVKYLVRKGADVNASDKDGRTVLELINLYEVKDSFRMTKYLVSQGADVNAKDNDGFTVLDFADGRIAGYLRSVGAKKGRGNSDLE